MSPGWFGTVVYRSVAEFVPDLVASSRLAIELESFPLEPIDYFPLPESGQPAHSTTDDQRVVERVADLG
jgi:hypothetical protein